jgi:ATP-binding cassette, subfamily C, bacterial
MAAGSLPPSGEASGVGSYITQALTMLGLPTTLGVLIVVMAGAMVLKSLLAFLALSYAGYSGAKVAAGIRKRLLSALFAARWSYFADHRVGRIANAISNDATRAGDAYAASARFVAFAVQATVYLMIAALISTNLAIAGAVGGLVLVLGFRQLVKTARRAGYRQTDTTSSLVTYVSDALNNIKPIKAMEREALFMSFFFQKIKALRRALLIRTLARQGLTHGQHAVQAVAIAIGAYVAAVHMGIPLPELVVLGIIFAQVVGLFAKLQNILEVTAEIESAYWRTQELIDELTEEAETDTGTTAPTLEHGCRFDAVSFAYGDQTIIDNATLEIPAGQITVLQGASGSGKTTLIDLLTSLHRPSSGRITVDGVPIEQLSIRAWRRLIGYVPQELSLAARHDPGERRPRRCRHRRRGDPHRPGARRRRKPDPGARPRPRQRRRRDGHQAVRRPAPAHRARPCPGARAEAADPRRGDERARSRNRRPDLPRGRHAQGRLHHRRHHPSPRLDGHRRPPVQGRRRPGHGRCGPAAAARSRRVSVGP